MPRNILVIAAILYLLSSPELWAQQNKNFKPSPYFKGRYKSISVPKRKMKTLCPGYVGSTYPIQGIGIKLGDPFALTYKAYLSRNFSVAMDVGRTSSGLYNGFHRENFEEAQQLDTLSTGSSINYFGHRAERDGVFTLKLLYSKPISKIEALRAYAGAGIQYRWASVSYTYIRENTNTSNELGRYIFDYSTSGVVGAVGIEYSHPSLPISSFFEFETYFDFTQFTDWIRLTGGVGIRYMF